MFNQSKQNNSNSDLKLPGVELLLESFSRVAKKEQNEPKDKSPLVVLDKSRLVNVESEHFSVYGASREQAEAIARIAENWLKDLNKDWFENKPITWPKKGEIIANVNSNLGACGQTNYNLDKQGNFLDSSTRVQGSPELLCDSVIPHEISHILVASNFPKQLIRWADEGIASSLECRAVKLVLEEIISSDIKKSEKGFAPSIETFDKILVRMEYPEGKKALVEFYAKSMSLTEFLIERGGKGHFMKFLKEANPEQTNLQHWNKLLNKYYNIDGSSELESRWRKWVRAK